MAAARYALAAFVIIVACGGSEPLPREPTPPGPPPEPERPMRVEGQLGSMDPRAFDVAFDRILGDLQQCHVSRLQKIRWLAGDVTFFVRIGEDGAVRYAFMQDSSLGDRDTEDCMLRVVSEKRWPPPIGGEAEVRKSLGFDAPSDVKPPVSWSSDEISPALVANNARLKACRGRTDGPFKATAYVIPGPPSADAPAAASPAKRGKKPPKRGKDVKPRGHFLTVGIAPPNREGAAAIDCFVDALKQMPLPSPGASAAKVRFSL